VEVRTNRSFLESDCIKFHRLFQRGFKDEVEDVGEDAVYVGRFKLIDAAYFAADQNYLTLIIQSHLLTLTVSFIQNIIRTRKEDHRSL